MKSNDIEVLHKRITCLREMKELQCSNGNWNCNNYMHGLANGLIFALSLMEEECPEFLSKPADGWLDDREPFTPTAVQASPADALSLAIAMTKGQP